MCTVAGATAVAAAPAETPDAGRTTLSAADIAKIDLTSGAKGRELLQTAIDAGRMSDGVAASAQQRARLTRDAVVIELKPEADASLVYMSSTPNFEVSYEGDLATAIRDQTIEINDIATGTASNATNGSAATYPTSGWWSAGTANFNSDEPGYAKFGSYEIRRNSAWHPTTGTNCGSNCYKYDAYMIKLQGNALPGGSGMRTLYANFRPTTVSGANIVQALPNAPVRSGGSTCVTANIGGTIGATYAPWSIGLSAGYTRQSCSTSEVTNGRIINTTNRQAQTFWWKETSGGVGGARTIAGSTMTEIRGGNAFPSSWSRNTGASSTCCS